MPHEKQYKSQPQLLYTLRDAAAMLAVGLRTMERLIQSGEIPVVRIGRSVRCHISDLHRWIETKRTVIG